MKKAAAIVTNRGGRTCHAAIVSRELGLPAAAGTEHGTEVLQGGQIVTVSCAERDVGLVYEGKLAFEVERIDLQALARPNTKVMMNVGNPEDAFALSLIPNDGVGLAREEFIIGNYIKVHPLALLDYERLDDPAVKSEIDLLTAGYADKPGFLHRQARTGRRHDRGTTHRPRRIHASSMARRTSRAAVDFTRPAAPSATMLPGASGEVPEDRKIWISAREIYVCCRSPSAMSCILNRCQQNTQRAPVCS